MKAIVRNFLLAIIISTFAMFGALGGKPLTHAQRAKMTTQQLTAWNAEGRKETLTCISVALIAWGLCFWRCAVINRRLAAERMYKLRFNEYMRNAQYHRSY
jgi:hypothetical protein